MIKLGDLNFAHCEGYYSKNAEACICPCSISEMDGKDQMLTIYEKVKSAQIHTCSMSEKKTSSYMPAEMLAVPFVIGKAGFDMALMATVSIARMAQIAVQSADTGLGKFIELTEQEIKKDQRRESIKVE